MRKKYTFRIATQNYIFLILLFTANVLVAQVDCPEPNAGAFLELNNVKAWINNDQLQFYDGTDATYEVPAGAGVSAFFATNLWIGGWTADGQLKMAADLFGQGGSRFAPGPLNDVGMVDEDLCDTYNRLYIVTRNMSETHALYFQSIEDGTVDEDFPDGYQLPQVLLDYPGSIFTSTGLNEHGAPYYDYNGDGLYDATLGDYPLFSGMNEDYECQSCETLNGDICFYWINNDMKTFEDQSPLGIEIHNMAYAFASDDDVNNTIFFQKKIINRGVQILSNTHVGIWADPDLGCGEDDFSACDVQRSLGIVVNADDLDASCFVPGYGESPPSAGVLALSTPLEYNEEGELIEVNMSSYLSYSRFYDYPQIDPNSAIEFSNYLVGNWLDGQPLTYGGTGIYGSQSTAYMFPHDTDPEGTGTDGIPQDSWSEFEEANEGTDRRFVMSFGPFELEPGEVNCLTYATIYAENDGSENPLSAIQSVSDEIQASYDNCFEEIISGIGENEAEEIAIINWNVSSSLLTINATDNQDLTVLIIDDIGRQVKSIEANNPMHDINLQDIASGMYVVSIINQKGTRQSEKIVKL